MSSNDDKDVPQNTQDLTVFVQNLLQQMVGFSAHGAPVMHFRLAQGVHLGHSDLGLTLNTAFLFTEHLFSMEAFVLL